MYICLSPVYKNQLRVPLEHLAQVKTSPMSFPAQTSNALIASEE